MANQNAAVAKRPDTQTLAEQTGLEVRQVEGGMVTLFKGPDGSLKPYIGAAARRYKMDERFGAGNYRINADLPTLEAYQTLRQMWGVPQGAPCIIIECEITDRAGVRLSHDYGTATPSNMLGGKKQFEDRGLEIATTRAINRAMGQLTANGFGDINNKATDAYQNAPMPYQADFLQLCQDVKKQIGEQAYYSVLGNYGAQHANDAALLSDPVMMQQVADDLKAARARNASNAVFGDEPEKDAPTKASDEDIEKIRELAKDPLINDRERAGIERRIADGMTEDQAEEAHAWLEEQIEGRREQEEGEQGEDPTSATDEKTGDGAQDHPGDEDAPTTFGAVVAYAEKHDVSKAWVKEAGLKIHKDLDAMDPDQIGALFELVKDAAEKKQK